MAKYYEIKMMTEDEEVISSRMEVLFLDDEFIDLENLQSELLTDCDAYIIEVSQDGDFYGCVTEDYVQYESWVTRQMTETEYPQMI